jgi:hypothetical protein
VKPKLCRLCAGLAEYPWFSPFCLYCDEEYWEQQMGKDDGIDEPSPEEIS